MLVGHKKTQPRILVGLLNGQIALNRHLSAMKIRTDPLCPACGEEEEISYHLLGKCCAYMLSRYSIVGAYTMEPLTGPLRGFPDLWSYWVAQWAEHTRPQHWAASAIRPKGKGGKGKDRCASFNSISQTYHKASTTIMCTFHSNGFVKTGHVHNAHKKTNL